jgi:ligand-binding sensor domain-containing protein
MQLLHAEKNPDALYDWLDYYVNTGYGYALTVDDRNIYVGTCYGLVIINKDTHEETLLERTKGLTDNYITCLNNIGGEIWYGGYYNGFGKIENGEITNFTRSSLSLNSQTLVTDIEKDKDGNIWIASLGDLFKIVDGVIVEWYPFPYDPLSAFMAINDIFIDDDGTIWVSGYDTIENNGLGKLTEKGISMVYDGLGICWNIIKDRSGNKWVSADDGLLKFRDNDFTEYKTDDAGVSLGKMRCLTEDKDGNLWAVRDSFLLRYDGHCVTSYHAHCGLATMCMHDGLFYMGTASDEVLVFKDGQFESIPLLSYPNVLSPLVMSNGGSIDHEGNYLAGTKGSGMMKLKPDGSFTKAEFFGNRHISETVADSYGDIWVISNWGNFRLYKITQTDTINYQTGKRCPFTGYEDIFQVAVDHQDRLWVAAENGLHCFNGETWQTFNKDNSGLTTNRVYCVAFDKNNVLWTCCGKGLNNYYEMGDGLFRYDGNTWLRYVSQHDVNRITEGYVPLTYPFPTNSIGSIIIDDNNTFWMAVNINEEYMTDNIYDWHGGLIRWDGNDDWQHFMRRCNELPDSIASDLPGNWINCIDYDKHGRIWMSFEGDYGIAMYDGKDFTVWDMSMPGIGFGEATNMCVDKERDRIWISHSVLGVSCASTAKILGGSTDIKSIPLPKPSTWQQDSGRMFDLNGKRLLQPKRSEVYIQDGKKHIRR